MGFNIITQMRMAELSAIAAFYTDEYCNFPGPVDPVLITDSQNLSYSTNDYGKAFDGLLQNLNGNFHMFINTGQGGHLYQPRTRFSMAHELGHYLIPEHYRALSDPRTKPIPSFQTFDTFNHFEVEADYFASCLLMPEDRFARDISKKHFNFTLIDALSSKYNVSVTATLLRFIGIGNYPIMVVCTRKGIVKWKRFSHDFPFLKLLINASGQVPTNTSAGEYFYENIKNYNKTETVFAKDWFVLQYSADKNRQFKEYCIYYEPLEQVISVLWE